MAAPKASQGVIDRKLAIVKMADFPYLLQLGYPKWRNCYVPVPDCILDFSEGEIMWISSEEISHCFTEACTPFALISRRS